MNIDIKKMSTVTAKVTGVQLKKILIEHLEKELGAPVSESEVYMYIYNSHTIYSNPYVKLTITKEMKE